MAGWTPDSIKQHIIDNWYWYGLDAESEGYKSLCWKSLEQCIRHYQADTEGFILSLTSIESLEKHKAAMQKAADAAPRDPIHRSTRHPDTDAIMVRIANDYAAGMSPAEIADAEGINIVGVYNVLRMPMPPDVKESEAIRRRDLFLSAFGNNWPGVGHHANGRS